jgi:hypothetical protein
VVNSAHIITMQSADGRFPSDHYPVVAKYRLAP